MDKFRENVHYPSLREKPRLYYEVSRTSKSATSANLQLKMAKFLSKTATNAILQHCPPKQPAGIGIKKKREGSCHREGLANVVRSTAPSS